MNTSHFLNDKGKYTAKRLPSPSDSSVKFKDITDLTGLRYALQDERPQTASQFEAVYKNEFSDLLHYEVEVEDFEEALSKNREDFLGESSGLIPYFQELINLIDLDENPEEYDWLRTSLELKEQLVKANLALSKDSPDEDDWRLSLNCHRLSELKTIAKPLGIKVSQTKSSLIEELLSYQYEHGPVIPKPNIIKFKPELLELLQEIQSRFVSDIQESLEKFDYPRSYKAAIWQEVVDYNDQWPTIHEQASDELAKYQERNLDNVFSKETPNITNSFDFELNTKQDDVFTLPKSQEVVFDYIDAEGLATHREVRLDKVISNDHAYLVGFCYMRKATRHFRVDRIQGDIVIRDTGEVVSCSGRDSTLHTI